MPQTIRSAKPRVYRCGETSELEMRTSQRDVLTSGVLNRGRQVAFDHSLGNRVSGEAGYIMNSQLVHDLLPVLFNGLDADG